MNQTFYIGMKICDYYAIHIMTMDMNEKKWFEKMKLMDLFIA